MTTRGDLDRLLSEIDSLEQSEHDDCTPRPGETTEEFRARMLAELDELLAAERAAGVRDTEHWWDAARWKPSAAPFDPLTAPYLVQDGEEVLLGGPLTVSIGGRRLGTASARRGHWDGILARGQQVRGGRARPARAVTYA